MLFFFCYFFLVRLLECHKTLTCGNGAITEVYVWKLIEVTTRVAVDSEIIDFSSCYDGLACGTSGGSGP